MATSFSYYISITTARYTETTGPDRSISWERGNPTASPPQDLKSGPDGSLTAGVDWFISPLIPYSGYTFDFEGNIYAIFRDSRTDTLYIPYDPAEGDLDPFFLTPGSTSAYTPTGAQVFNCFATGTRIATPDGDKPIEMLRAGDLVLTHDGRAAPVIWRAWQSVVNPRNLSVGRSPVRIEAGALGPNLPNGPPITPCCSTTC